MKYPLRLICLSFILTFFGCSASQAELSSAVHVDMSWTQRSLPMFEIVNYDFSARSSREMKATMYVVQQKQVETIGQVNISLEPDSKDPIYIAQSKEGPDGTVAPYSFALGASADHAGAKKSEIQPFKLPADYHFESQAELSKPSFVKTNEAVIVWLAVFDKTEKKLNPAFQNGSLVLTGPDISADFMAKKITLEELLKKCNEEAIIFVTVTFTE